MGSVNVWGADYSERVFSFTTASLTTGATTNGEFNKLYYKISQGGYAQITAESLFGSEALSTDMTINVACGTFGTWTNSKTVTLTAAFYDAANNELSSTTYTTEGLNSTQGTYRGNFTLSKPTSPNNISYLKVTFTTLNSGSTARLAGIKLTYSTAKAAPAEPIDNYWKVNGEDYDMTETTTGKPVLPAEPSQNCDGRVFVGWTTSENYSNPTTGPTDLFSTSEEAPDVTTETTFYAVFANEKLIGTQTETLTLTHESITAAGSGSSGYAKYNGTRTLMGSKGTDVDIYTNQVMPNSSKIQFQSDKGLIYNTTSLEKIKSIEITGTTAVTVKEGSSSNPSEIVTSSNGSYVLSGTNGYFSIKGESSTPKAEQIVITFEIPSPPEHTNYSTKCKVSNTLAYENQSVDLDTPFELFDAITEYNSEGNITYDFVGEHDGASISNTNGNYYFTGTKVGTYTIRASQEEDANTQAVTFDFTICVRLAKPTNLTQTVTTPTARLSWDGVKGATGYTVQMLSDDKSEVLNSYPTTNTYYDLSNLILNDYYVWGVTATNGTECCNSAQETSEFTAENAACTAWSFHYGVDGAPADEWTIQCFTQNPDNANEYFLHDFEIPDKPNYYVGLAGGWDNSYSEIANFSSDGDKNHMTFVNIQLAGWTGKPFPGVGAVGTLRIYDNSGDKNKYIAFIPDGYSVTYGIDGSQEPWTNVPFHWVDGNKWETAEVAIANSYTAEYITYTGVTKADGTVAFGDHKSFKKSLSSIYEADKEGSMAAGVHGIFRMSDAAGNWEDNFQTTFIPYYNVLYHDHEGNVTGSSEYISSEKSDEDRTIRLSFVPERDGYSFQGWAHTQVDAEAGTVKIAPNGSCKLWEPNAPLYPVWIPNPTLSVSPTELSLFEYEGQGPSAPQEITVKGANLQDDKTIRIIVLPPFEGKVSGEEGDYSDVIELTETDDDNAIEQTISVRLKAGLEPGDYIYYDEKTPYSATFQTYNCEHVSVPLTGKVTAKYTLKYYINGEEKTVDVLHGDKILDKLPSVQVPAGCDMTTFVGWTRDKIEEKPASTMPELLTDADVIDGDIEVYALFSGPDESRRPTTTTTYTKITSEAELADKWDYLIVGYDDKNGYYALKNTSSTAEKIDGEAVTPNADAITTTDANIIWYLTVSDDNWSLYNEAAAKYCVINSSEKAELSGTGKTFTVSASSSVFNWQAEGKSLSYYNKVFNAYSRSNTVYVYKRDAEKFYITNCSTKEENTLAYNDQPTEGEEILINTSFTLANAIVAESKNSDGAITYMITNGPEGGASISEEHTTFTATATGTYTIQATQAATDTHRGAVCTFTIEVTQYFTIEWLNNGESAEGAPTTPVKEGNKVEELPTPPDAPKGCSKKVFMGWTDAAIDTEQESAPEVLFTDAAGSPEIKGNTTFYAVFADKNIDGEGNISEVAEGTYYISHTRDGVTYYLQGQGTADNPAAVTDKTQATRFDVVKSGENYILYLHGNHDQWLYSQNANQGVRMGDGANNVWAFEKGESSKAGGVFNLKNTQTSSARYLALYNENDFRTYTNPEESNRKENSDLEYAPYYDAYTTTCVYYPEKERKVTVEVNIRGAGTASADCGEGTVYEGNSTTLTATANEGYTFVNWTIVGENNGGATIEPADALEATLTVGAENVEVTANFRVLDEYTITWKYNHNEENYTTGEPTTKVLEGGKIIALPTPPNVPVGCMLEKTFVGWTASDTHKDTPSDIAPSDLFTTPEGAPAIMGSTTFYAVFAAPAEYAKITSTDELTDGIYLIVAEDKNVAMGSQNSNYRNGVDVTITEGAIKSLPEGVAEVTIEAGSSAGTFALKVSDGYLYWTGQNNVYTGEALYDWNIAFSDGDANITSAETPARKLQWNAGSPRFACYTSEQTAIQLYKKSSPGYTTYCDEENVTVHSGKTWTITEDINIVHLTVNPDAKVEVADGATLNVKSVTLRSEGDVVPHLVLPSTNSKLITENARVDFTKWITNDRYYIFALPYDCKVDEIRFKDGTEATLGTNFLVKHYDGDKRVETGGKSSSWVAVKAGETLQAGKGYEVAVSYEAGKELVFPMTLEDGNLHDYDNANKSFDYKAYGITSNTEATYAKDRTQCGWNLIGNPYLTHHAADGLGDWMLSIPEGSTYAQTLASAATLSPFSAFFIQTEEDGSLAFSKTAPRALLAPRFAPAERPVYAGISLSNGVRKDETTLVIGDQFTQDYEIGADLEKMLGLADKPQVYTIEDANKYAFKAINEQDAANANMLGVYLPAEGEYTFDVMEAYDLSGVQGVYLTDNVVLKTVNLMAEPYTFTNAQEHNTTRFTLSVVRKPEATTDLGHVQATWSLWQDAPLHISVQGLMVGDVVRVIDATGKLVDQLTARETTVAFDLPTAGGYCVQTIGVNGIQMKKIVVR